MSVKQSHPENAAIAIQYWEWRFDVGYQHHSRQCAMLTKSLVEIIRKRERRGHPQMADALRSSRIIEVGCGTGELANKIRTAFQPPLIVGTDLSPRAVERARRRFPHTQYTTWDVLDKTWSMSGPFQLALMSNTLEHFRDWQPVVNRLLLLAGQLILVVPYNQPESDAYDCEGGAGHVATFDKTSFDEYTVIDRALFKSPGWSHSVMGEPPLQLAVLLK